MSRIINEKLKNNIIATSLLLYGVVKIGVGYTATFSSKEAKDQIKKKIPVTKAFYSDDETLAGKGVEFSFFLFGIFSLLHGLDKFHVLPSSISKILEQKRTETVVYLVLGLGLVLFYSLVLFTDVPISKKEENTNHYRLLGILGGLSFLIYPAGNAVLTKQRQFGTFTGAFSSSGEAKVEVGILLTIVISSIKVLYDSLDLKDKHIKNDIASLLSVVGNMT